MNEKLYTTREFARALGLSHSSVRDYVQRGLLVPAVCKARFYLFTEATLARFRETPRRAPGRPKGSVKARDGAPSPTAAAGTRSNEDDDATRPAPDPPAPAAPGDTGLPDQTAGG